MPISKEKNALRHLRDNPEGIAELLNKSLDKNEIKPVFAALRNVVLAQNVAAIARQAGMKRDRLYRSFGGEVDPTLSRVLKLLWALNIRLVAVPGPIKPTPRRPQLGRPKKQTSSAHPQNSQRYPG
jgi:probable addiction module antidote protein